jgi:hypothetical protein
MDYGFNLKYNTPDFISWAQTERDRSDKRAQERMQNYINLMQMLGRGVGAYMYGKQARDKAAANKAWDTYMPAAQDLYNSELIGNVKSYDDTVNNLQMLGLNPYLTDIDKFRNLGADLEFDYTE